MIDIEEAQIYVGTYRKYNEGSLYGKWMKLADYADFEEFIEACKILHKDEDDPELMYQGWQYMPDALINESWLSENFFEFRDAVETLKNDDQDAFMVWVDFDSHDLVNEDLYNLIGKFRDAYQGKYDSEEEYARQFVEDCYDLSEFAQTYFDYDKFASDLFMTDFWYEDGYVFRR